MTESAPPRRGPEARAFPFIFTAVLLFFVASGACGLLYQVVWTRQLVLIFGTTAYAVSTVLTVFFLGLGLGSLWGGRLADRHPAPLRLYGYLEIIIGLWAAALLLALSYGEPLLAALLREVAASRGVGIVLRAVLTGGLLLAPVAMMGATLPLLARFVNREAHVQGLRIGALYTLNTLGAVAGCFITGFFLIATLGYTWTTLIGAAINIGVGVLAIALSLAVEKDAISDAAPRPVNVGGTSLTPGFRGAALIGAFALSGFCALALEVIWTRLLAMVFLGTTYAYTTMLTTLLCGIVAGSAVASFLCDRTRAPQTLFGAALLAAAAGVLLQLAWIGGLPETVSNLHASSGNRWDAVVRGTFFHAFLVLFPATFFLGMTFPLVVKAAVQRAEHLGVDVGRLYFANTIGGVFGAASGGFLIIPLFGAHQGMTGLALLMGLGGAVALIACPMGSARLKAGILAAAIVAMGLSLYRAPADVSQALNAGYIPEDHRVLHYAEGTEGTVAVSEPRDETEGKNRVLWINRVQATTSIERGVKMNRFQAALPHLFDREIEDVLFMCFGSGITCGALAVSGLYNIDAVDISPEVIAAAPYFAADNLRVWEQPNVTFHIDDGRNFLLTSRKQYDFITFEPMPLALAGVSTFYTADYYRLCLDRLAPGGLVSQWVPLHSLNPEVVQSLVQTFVSVFPEYCAFYVNADLFLIGSDEPITIDLAKARQRLRFPGLREALAEVGYPDLESVLASFVMEKEGMRAFAEGGRVMTDDRPWAEFEAPKLVYARKVPEAITLLQRHVGSPRGLFSPAPGETAAHAFEQRHASAINDLEALKGYYGGLSIGRAALSGFLESLAIDSQNTTAQFYLLQIAEHQAETLLRWEEYEDALDVLEASLAYLPHEAQLHRFAAEAHEGLGNEDAAARHRRLATGQPPLPEVGH